MTDNLTKRVKDALTPEQINELVGEIENMIDVSCSLHGEATPIWYKTLTAIRQLQEEQKDAEQWQTKAATWHLDMANALRKNASILPGKGNKDAAAMLAEINEEQAQALIKMAVDERAIQTKEQRS